MLGELAMRLHIRHHAACRSSMHSFARRDVAQQTHIPVDFRASPRCIDDCRSARKKSL
jgi:hypothetical protein